MLRVVKRLFVINTVVAKENDHRTAFVGRLGDSLGPFLKIFWH